MGASWFDCAHHALSIVEGRPSDSPTPSLARAFALASAPAARSLRSLALNGGFVVRLRSPRPEHRRRAPLGLPYAVARSRLRARIRSGGSVAALPRADRGVG